MKHFIVKLEKWAGCSNSYKDVGFWRRSYGPCREDVIIWYQPDEGWFVEQPTITDIPDFTNTPELLMMKVDLALLECNDGASYDLEEPFIFPNEDE